jgi:hypothetical protein
LIEKYRENLFTQSNNFSDSDWNTTSGSSFVGGQSGYDGTSDAWLFTDSGAASAYGAYQDKVINGVHTYSIYVKEGSTSTFVIDSFQSPRPSVTIDLTNGNVTASDEIDAKSELISNGWYRLSLTFNASSTLYMRLGCNGAGSVYIQDAQLERGLAATSYLESGATTAKAGVLDNLPRIDYAGGTASLLLEPSRTNLIGYSEYLSGLSLFNSPTITQNYAVSPEGVQNAVRIQDTDGTNFKTIQTQFSISAGSTYTISVYVKKATSPITTYGAFYFDFDGGTRKISDLIFDEYNGTLVNALGNNITSVIHPVIDEGDYWRFSATATDTGSNTLLRATLRAGASANGTSLSLVTKDYTAYGFQCEQGSYPTSYIPTYGTSVTRSFDYSIVESLGYSSTCTFYYEFNTTTGREASSPFAEVGKDTSNKFYIKGASTNNPQFQIQGNGIFSGSISPTNEISGINKIAVQWSSGVGVVFCNGVKQSGTLANSNTSENIDFIAIKGEGTLHDSKKLLFFPTAITDRELVDLTSPYSTYQELVTAEGLTWESPTCTTNSITELQSI